LEGEGDFIVNNFCTKRGDNKNQQSYKYRFQVHLPQEKAIEMHRCYLVSTLLGTDERMMRKELTTKRNINKTQDSMKQ